MDIARYRNKYICGGPRSNDIPMVMNTLAASSRFLNSILHEKELGLLGEMANSRAGEGRCKMSLEYLFVPDNKEVLQD